VNYQRDSVSLHREELGGISFWWTSIPGHPQRCVGNVEQTTREEAINCAIHTAERTDKLVEIEENFRTAHPNRQIYIACLNNAINRLPGAKVQLPPEGIGEYLFVFPARRKAGVYYLKDYIKIW